MGVFKGSVIDLGNDGLPQEAATALKQGWEVAMTLALNLATIAMPAGDRGGGGTLSLGAPFVEVPSTPEAASFSEEAFHHTLAEKSCGTCVVLKITLKLYFKYDMSI